MAEAAHVSSEMETLLCASVAASLNELGFEFFIFAQQHGRFWRPTPWSHVPDELAKAYVDNRIADVDPVLSLARRKRGLCDWPLASKIDNSGHLEFSRCMSSSHIVTGVSASFIGISLRCDIVSALSTRSVHLSDVERDWLLSKMSSFWHHQHEQEWIRLSALPQVSLTPREHQVIYWMKEGKSYRDIATITGLSQRVIEFHARNVIGKLGAGDKTTAVVEAIKQGLIAL